MRAFFKGSGSSATTSKASSPTPSIRNGSTRVSTDARDVEISDMQDAMEAAARILNDDIDGAEVQLRARKSSFHSLGLGISVFMRSILGFEKDIMAEASSRLADCESRSWADMKKAQKLADGGGGGWFRGGGSSSAANAAPHGCQLYPPGTEYQLLNAEAQLMGAVISVMNESLTEGIKGFYKLRKAFLALDVILAEEAKVLPTLQGNGAAKTSLDAPQKAAADQKLSDSDSDLEFVEAPEDAEQEKTTGSNTPPRAVVAKGPDSSAFTNPVDAFVHSGANMCFGLLLLIISMVPPAFSKLLYIIGFKGDRERGVAMLWQSTRFDNVNGGVAGLMLLGYYNGLLANADILPSESDAAELADDNEIVGYPQKECGALLTRMREQFPDSGIWKVEEARVLANERRLADAIAILKTKKDSKMRQITALKTFELSVNSLFMMEWSTMRDGFLKCTELNDWSHSLYYYFVGCAELEMYRDAVAKLQAPATDAKEKGTLEADAKRHKKLAEEFFRKCPSAAGRKKFLARQMPFEVFALRKVAKWEARAKEWGVDMADAVGASPAHEMAYLWSGGKRMSPAQIESALAGLQWERCTAPAAQIELIKAIPDEAAIKAVAESALLCNMGRYAEARERVKPVSEQDK